MKRILVLLVPSFGLFALLFLLTAYARPALAQSADEGAGIESKTKTAVSKLSVSPKTLSYNVNLDKVPSQTKSFTIKNTGTATLDGVSVSGASAPYSIPSSVPISVAAKGKITVEVVFKPSGAGTDNETLTVSSSAISGPTSATVNLKGKATQKPTKTAMPTKTATPTATATATKTATATATATPTATATGATPTATRTATPSPSPSPGGTPTATPTGATPTATPTATSTATALPGIEQYEPVLE